MTNRTGLTDASLVPTGRLKDFRRIATRYDRSATNFLATVCLAASQLLVMKSGP